MNKTDDIKLGLDAARLINHEAAIIENDFPIHTAKKCVDSAIDFLSSPPEWVERVTPRALMYEAVSRAIADVKLDSHYHTFFYDDAKEDISEILDDHGETATRWEVMNLAAHFCDIVGDQYGIWDQAEDRALQYTLWSKDFITPEPRLKREFNEVDSLREYVNGKAMEIRHFARLYVDVKNDVAGNLRDSGIFEVGDLTELSESALRAIEGIGRITVREIKSGLSELRLGLAED